MCVCETYAPHIELAIDVFKAKNRASINYLKDFLLVLPSAKCIEFVLLTAIYRLAEIDLNACRWVLCNSRALEPELDLVEVARKFALKKLKNQGFVVERDFSFTNNGGLQVNEVALAGLKLGNSACDRLLLFEILQVSN